MQITVKNPCTVDGVTYASGSQTVSDPVGAKLIELGRAVNNFPKNPAVPAMVEFDPVTRGLKLSGAVKTVGQARSVVMRHLGRAIGPVSGGYLDNTYRMMITLPFPAEVMKLHVGTKEASAFVGAIASIAPTSGTDEETPVGGTYSQFMSGGSAAMTVPASDGTSPKYKAYDALRVEPLVGSDGKYRYILNIYLPTAGYSYFETPADANSTGKQNLLPFVSRRLVGDFATVANVASWTTQSRTTVFPLFALEIFGAAGARTIIGCGDSIMYGQDSGSATGQGYGWLRRALDDTRNAQLIGYINEGWPGQTSATYAARAKETVVYHKPTVAFYTIASPNDGTPSQALINAAIARAMDFADYCERQGTTCVFVTQTPRDTYDATADGFRKALNSWAMNSGIPTVDAASAVGDGASPERYKSGHSADGLHPNETGKEAMRVVGKEWMAQNMPSVLDF